MRHTTTLRTFLSVFLILAMSALLPCLAQAQDPVFTTDFNREGCTFATAGNNPFLPIWPGLSQTLEGEEEDDEGELVEISSVVTILTDTEVVDGVLTRVLEEVESEDGELTEISRNFVAVCRETGDVWYFGEDVDDYEDGEIVGHEGAWRAGIDGAKAGILMPGTPIIGARYFQEIAPGVAEDRGEITGMGAEYAVPAGTYSDTLEVVDTDALDPDPEGGDLKVYAAGVGIIKDEDLELVELTMPACVPDAHTHCLADGRFKVEVDWIDGAGEEFEARAILSSGESGEFWFFSPGNTELLVKVLDACDTSDSFWVFAAGLTNVGVDLEVTDMVTCEVKDYENPFGTDYQPILDTGAFFTCDGVSTGPCEDDDDDDDDDYDDDDDGE